TRHLKLFDLPVDSRQYLPRGAPHLLARGPTRLAGSQERAHFGKPKSKAQRIANELDALNRLFRIQAVSAIAARNRGKQSHPLVIPERVGTHPCPRRNLPDAMGLSILPLNIDL